MKIKPFKVIKENLQMEQSSRTIMPDSDPLEPASSKVTSLMAAVAKLAVPSGPLWSKTEHITLLSVSPCIAKPKLKCLL